MAWKRGDVVWSNMTLGELILSLLALCFLIPVLVWTIAGLFIGFTSALLPK